MSSAEKKEQFKPFVPMDVDLPETNGVTLILGIIFTVIFAMANVYLGLKVGLTIAAAIPGSILATGLLKIIFKKNSILEANLVASMGAVGESIAGGIIFTLPAIIIWGEDLSFVSIGMITVLGGILGIMFVVPFREYLIVEEHGSLIFPESVAVAEILTNANQGGDGLKTVIKGMGAGGLFKFLGGGIALFNEEPIWQIGKLSTAFGMNAVASLIGVGFIVGLEVAIFMFSGALLAWFGFIPIIKFIGANAPTAIFPGPIPISEMAPIQIWSYYLRYIGAGAVATGGFISLIKSVPAIINSFREAMKGLKAERELGHVERQDIDTPLSWVIGISVAGFVMAWFYPMISGMPSLGPLVAFLVVLLSFFFGVVSARMCGTIGASNNPVSGMTIACLLVLATVIKVTNLGGNPDVSKVLAIVAAGIVCVSIAVSGGTAQSLKHTYLIGGTPKKIEWCMYLGLIFAAFASGEVILLLNKAFVLGSEKAPAPQAGLMKMISEGVMTGNIPWTLVLIGVVFGIVVFLLKLPVLALALGFYLPIGLSSGILVGAILRVIIEKMFLKKGESKSRVEKGVLLSSGVVAGDALMGILLALIITTGHDMSSIGQSLGSFAHSPWVSLVFIIILSLYVLYEISTGKSSKEKGYE
ncbi:OPT family oligopeptide transporter [Cetobacterium sp. SF1]|uniref:OPT family oligopeptide transporter n=1 Tax=unclassified Cetobacterium TaxID=2630983 RepID=UPI003CED6702